MPILYILGGANGVGKSTWYSTGVENGYIDLSLPFLNSDNVQKELGAYNVENSIIAEDIVRNRMKELILEKKDFMIESNLAKAADYEWINLMRKQGYQTDLIFLGIDDVEINKERVLERVREGGHDVPVPIIEQRYRMGLSYLKKEILSFDKARLIDMTSGLPKIKALLNHGKIQSKEPEAPRWVNEVLFLAERLQQKQQQSLTPEQKWEQFISQGKQSDDTQDQERDKGFDRGLSL